MSTKQSRRDKFQISEMNRAAKVERSVSSSATKFLLIRHGETSWNAEHRLQGQQDVSLNDLGQKQAMALARGLRGDASGSGALIFSSDLQRAAQTAQAIAAARSSDSGNGGTSPGTVIMRPAFRERSLGVLEGQTPAEGRTWHPEAWHALCSEDCNIRIPGGESTADVELRACKGLEEIARQHPGKTAIVVTHGGVLQVLYRYATGREYGGKFKNCAVNVLWIDGKEWKVGLFGDLSHLEEDGVAVQAEAFGGGEGG